ncbi:unnamed protein product [Scytosiphon promiscuus]
MQRVFIHYVLGKMLLLFFLCHPGTLATCDGQAYLRNRYANRDLVKTEAELEDHRRHYKPRDASEFTMRIGVPDEILHGDVTGYAPDWTPTLEQRFRDTIMSWLRKGRTPAGWCRLRFRRAGPPRLRLLPLVRPAEGRLSCLLLTRSEAKGTAGTPARSLDSAGCRSLRSAATHGTARSTTTAPRPAAAACCSVASATAVFHFDEASLVGARRRPTSLRTKSAPRPKTIRWRWPRRWPWMRSSRTPRSSLPRAAAEPSLPLSRRSWAARRTRTIRR